MSLSTRESMFQSVRYSIRVLYSAFYVLYIVCNLLLHQGPPSTMEPRQMKIGPICDEDIAESLTDHKRATFEVPKQTNDGESEASRWVNFKENADKACIHASTHQVADHHLYFATLICTCQTHWGCPSSHR